MLDISKPLKRNIITKYIHLVDRDSQFNDNTQSPEDLIHLKDSGSQRLFRTHLAARFCAASSRAVFRSAVGIPHSTGMLAFVWTSIQVCVQLVLEVFFVGFSIAMVILFSVGDDIISVGSFANFGQRDAMQDVFDTKNGKGALLVDAWQCLQLCKPPGCSSQYFYTLSTILHNTYSAVVRLLVVTH